MLTGDQWARLRSKLNQQKKEIIQMMDRTDHFGTKDALVKESVGELSNYDNHPADTGSELYEQEKDLALDEHAREELADIEHALDAIENGSYGTCEVCGGDIPFERLEAIPSSTRCVEHAQDQSVSKRRPIEEEVITPQLEHEYNDDDATLFDAEDSWQAVANYGTSDTPSDVEIPETFSYKETVEEAESQSEEASQKRR